MTPDGSTSMGFPEFARSLNSGALDADLTAVVDLLRARQERLRKQSLRSFKVGDSVSFTHRGQTHTGTVTKVMVKNVKVRVPVEGRAFGVEWTCPPNLLERH